MPPVIIGAGIAAAASIASAKMASNSANKAAAAQGSAADKALAFEREKEAARRQEYDKAYAIWQAGRQQLAQRYGLPIEAIGGGGTPAPGGPAPGAFTGQRTANIRDLMQAGGGPVAENPQLPADLGRWDDWRSYGLGGPQGA